MVTVHKKTEFLKCQMIIQPQNAILANLKDRGEKQIRDTLGESF